MNTKYMIISLVISVLSLIFSGKSFAILPVQSTDVNRSYIQAGGFHASLIVTIFPQGAIDAGAQWRLVGGSYWYNSGTFLDIYAGGLRTIEFKNILYWNKPSNIDVNFSQGENATASGTYTQTGALTVTIEPQDAIDAGAQWRRIGTSNWNNSGVMEFDLYVGQYTVEFKPVLGWSTPPNRIITIIANQSTAINGAYNLKSAVNEIPKIFKVWPPFPNPMNPATTIRYEISSECNVSLIIYDIYGRRIAVLEDGIHPAGIYNVTWNGKDSNDTLTSSGVYFYCLKAGKSINTGKIIFLK